MAELISIYGARGTGKSTLARALSAKSFRTVILDPSRDWEKRGVRAASDLPDLSKKIARDWRKGFRITYTPPPARDALALHRISEMLCTYQDRYAHGAEILLVVDEMAEAYDNAAAVSDGLGGFRRVILQGRHYGIGVIGISQRPHDVAARFRDNCARMYVFQLHDHTSQDAILKRIGRHHTSQLRALPKYSYLACEAGRVQLGKVTNSGARRR